MLGTFPAARDCGGSTYPRYTECPLSRKDHYLSGDEWVDIFFYLIV